MNKAPNDSIKQCGPKRFRGMHGERYGEKVIARAYPPHVSNGVTRVRSPSFIAPVFVNPRRRTGQRRFFLLAVIFHHGQERRSPLKRLNSLAGFGRGRRRGLAGGRPRG